MGRRTNTAVWLDKYQRWQIKVQRDGKRRTFTSSTPGRAGQREANAKADQWLDFGIDGSQRVKDLWDRYTEGLRAISTTTYKRGCYMGEAWVKPRIGHKKISSLTEQDLQDVINAAARSGIRDKSRGLSKKSLENIRAELKAFLKFCRKAKVTTMYPEDLTVPAGARRSEKTVAQPKHLDILFSSEVTTYRGKLICDPLVNAYRLAVTTGLRPGELLGLEWADIEGNRVYVRRSINVFSEQTQGKNENAVRAFTMIPEALQVIEAQRASTGQRAGRIFEIPTQRVFRDSWYRYCKCNCIPHITPYELRHTFVSIAKVLPEGQVKPLVGHSKDMDTFGTYGHSIGDDSAATAQALSSAFQAVLQAGKGRVG